MSKEFYTENEYAEYWIEDGIIIERFKPHLILLNLKVAAKVVEDRLKISAGKTMPMLIDINNAQSIDKVTREYFSSGKALDYLSATALLVDDYIAWFGGNLFLKINKPPIEMEVFKVRSKAIAWLQNFKELNKSLEGLSGLI